ncbi:MAG: hypothetical protein ACRC5R_04020 [Mycoplasmatales bacterium]
MAIDFDKDSFLKKMNKQDIKEEAIIRKELKKRYNISIKPSNNRKLIIHSKKIGISKSELIDNLIEKNLD